MYTGSTVSIAGEDPFHRLATICLFCCRLITKVYAKATTLVNTPILQCVLQLEGRERHTEYSI